MKGTCSGETCLRVGVSGLVFFFFFTGGYVFLFEPEESCQDLQTPVAVAPPNATWQERTGTQTHKLQRPLITFPWRSGLLKLQACKNSTVWSGFWRLIKIRESSTYETIKNKLPVKKKQDINLCLSVFIVFTDLNKEFKGFYWALSTFKTF